MKNDLSGGLRLHEDEIRSVRGAAESGLRPPRSLRLLKGKIRFDGMSSRELQIKLRFDPKEIRKWASRYSYTASGADADLEKVIEREISPSVREKGFYTKDEFLTLCRWKSPRIVPNCERNEASFVEAATRAAFNTTHEHLRIAALTLLNGVSWPVASVLLHFGHREPYPILDFRALWSASVDSPSQYDFDFWWSYVECCRCLALDSGVSMRTLDRALWQYSKENQP